MNAKEAAAASEAAAEKLRIEAERLRELNEEANRRQMEFTRTVAVAERLVAFQKSYLPCATAKGARRAEFECAALETADLAAAKLRSLGFSVQPPERIAGYTYYAVIVSW